jgi:hypothetical protein
MPDRDQPASTKLTAANLPPPVTLKENTPWRLHHLNAKQYSLSKFQMMNPPRNVDEHMPIIHHVWFNRSFSLTATVARLCCRFNRQFTACYNSAQRISHIYLHHIYSPEDYGGGKYCNGNLVKQRVLKDMVEIFFEKTNFEAFPIWSRNILDLCSEL